MTGEERDGGAPFRGPLPAGFARRVLRVAPGDELDLDASGLRDALVVVEAGEAELECRVGACRRFGHGSMIAMARPPIVRVRSIGPDVLVLVAVARAAAPADR